MIKGINKRVIIIKNPESDLIEEAYFILKGNAASKVKPADLETRDMAAEANRLISDYHKQQLIMGYSHSQSEALEKKHAEIEEFLKSGKDTPKQTVSSNLTDDDIDRALFGDSPVESSIDGGSGEILHCGRKNFIGFFSAENFRKKYLKMPPLSFFVGAGVMSVIMILARTIEFFIIRK